MALVLGLTIGDVVDIADDWIALLSVDSRKSATLITNDGDKVSVSSERETEVVPEVWVQLGPRTAGRSVRLQFEAPRAVSILRRHPAAI